jgi:hypothetical protein
MPDWFLRDYIDAGLWPWLQQLDRSADRLYTHLNAQRSTRLGVYFEQLLSFYFSHYPRFALLAKNLQVHDGRRTIGEFDFIVLDKQEHQILHIEVAVKFYLGHLPMDGIALNNPPHHNWHQWIGPNRKDTLGLKMAHLQQHQLPLANTQAGQDTLLTIMEKPDQIRSRLLITGRFYFPSTLTIPAPTFSQNINANVLWSSSQRLLNTTTNNMLNDDYVCWLPRRYWLSAITGDDFNNGELSLLSKKECLDLVDKESRQNINDWQFARIDTQSMTEIGRFFIVNNLCLPTDANHQTR